MTPIRITPESLGLDCCDQPIIPVAKKLSMHTNRHTTTSGNSWGWIDGCSLNICWSNDNSKFDHTKAAKLVIDYNSAIPDQPPAPTERPGVEPVGFTHPEGCICHDCLPGSPTNTPEQPIDRMDDSFPQSAPATGPSDTEMLDWLIKHGYAPAQWRPWTPADGRPTPNGMVMIGPATRKTVRAAMRDKSASV